MNKNIEESVYKTLRDLCICLSFILLVVIIFSDTFNFSILHGLYASGLFVIYIYLALDYDTLSSK